MDQVHIHLLITHLPIFGSMLGGFVLAYGIWSRNEQTKIAANYVLIIASVGAVIAYSTGEGAEEVVEPIQGVAENMIEEHEDAGLTALVGMIVLGVFSLVSLYLTMSKSALASTSALVVLGGPDRILSWLNYSEHFNSNGYQDDDQDQNDENVLAIEFHICGILFVL